MSRFLPAGYAPTGKIYAAIESEGNATLVAGTASISNTKVHSQTNVLLTLKSPSGTLGVHYRYELNNGVGVTIESIDSSGSVETGDTSTISYVILN